MTHPVTLTSAAIDTRAQLRLRAVHAVLKRLPIQRPELARRCLTRPVTMTTPALTAGAHYEVGRVEKQVLGNASMDGRMNAENGKYAEIKYCRVNSIQLLLLTAYTHVIFLWI